MIIMGYFSPILHKNVCFYREIRKIIPELLSNTPPEVTIPLSSYGMFTVESNLVVLITP